MLRKHIVILESFLEKLKGEQIASILDAGSGGTSLSAIVKHFPGAKIDAVVYPGDQRKIRTILPVREETGADIQILEKDICHEEFSKSYDLITAHLLLGEAAKFGNRFETMLERLLAADFRYLIIIDYLEDPSVNEREILRLCEERGLQILVRQCLKNESPQTWENFTGVHNFGYLICQA